MKTTLILIICLNLFSLSFAQQPDDCGTKVSQYIDLDPFLLEKNRLLYTTPYQLRLFIHIIATDNGSSIAVSNQAAFETYLEDTRQFYASHNICFSLVAVETIYSTALFDMKVDDATDRSLLLSKLVPGAINVFFHNTLYDSYNSFNGNAYDIPNYYCSVVGSLVGSTNRTTMAHEMGHDFGLYHTFARANNTSETVPRTGSQSNCTVAGDLICDTHADPNPPASQISTSCVYTGNATDSLGYYYTPPVTNIMAYGRYECRDIFTAGQRDRMHYFITSTPSITSTLNEDNVTVLTLSNTTISSGIYIKAARTNLAVSPSADLIISGTTHAYFTAGNYIKLSPGVKLTPGAGGLSILHMNTMCQ